MQLREKLSPNKMGYPKSKIFEAINENPQEIQNLLIKEERAEAANTKSKISLTPGGGVGGLGNLNLDATGIGGDLGLGGPPGGGSPGAGGPTGEKLNINPAELPSFNGGEKQDLGNSKMPPESAKMNNENVPTGVG